MTKKLYAYVYVDVDQQDKVMPLHVFDNSHRPYAAFVQLDGPDGVITFGIEDRTPLRGARSWGPFIRLAVPAKLRGDRLQALGEKIRPLAQRIFDDIKDAGADVEARLGPDAKAARDEIEIAFVRHRPGRSRLDRPDPPRP